MEKSLSFAKLFNLIEKSVALTQLVCHLIFGDKGSVARTDASHISTTWGSSSAIAIWMPVCRFMLLTKAPHPVWRTAVPDS